MDRRPAILGARPLGPRGRRLLLAIPGPPPVVRFAPTRPCMIFRAALQLARPGDSYLDLTGWNNGYLWVSGRLLGRYWYIGPQQRLFCLGVWLREGDNDALCWTCTARAGADRERERVDALA